MIVVQMILSVRLSFLSSCLRMIWSWSGGLPVLSDLFSSAQPG